MKNSESYEHLLQDGSIHVISNVCVLSLHPELSLTSAGGAPHLHVEEAVGAPTTPDTHELQHIC